MAARRAGRISVAKIGNTQEQRKGGAQVEYAPCYCRKRQNKADFTGKIVQIQRVCGKVEKSNLCPTIHKS